MKNLTKWLAVLIIMFVVYVAVTTLIWYCTQLTNGELIYKIEYYSLNIITGLVATPIAISWHMYSCKKTAVSCLKGCFGGMIVYQVVMVAFALMNYFRYGFLSNILMRGTWSIGTAILYYRWNRRY